MERAVQTVEGQIRVMKIALEARLGTHVGAGANIVTFMAEYASFLLNRLDVGKDGKTAWERVKEKSATVLAIEFGEKLLWKKKAQSKMDNISSSWEYGIFVGVRVRSGEFWVATKAGVNKARCVRRIPEEDRWSKDCMDWVKHMPWHFYKGHPEADGEIPEENIVETRTGVVRPVDDMESPLVVVRTRQVRPRAFQIREEDAEVHGYTRGCAGCSSWFRGLGRQPHTSECRARFVEVMKEDARYQNAEKRKQEFEVLNIKPRSTVRLQGVVDMGYRESRILSQHNLKWIWTTNTEDASANGRRRRTRLPHGPRL